MLRLPVVWMGLGGAWAVVAGLMMWFGEVDLNPWWSDPVAFGVLIGLAVTAVGATRAALAGAVPGLEKNASAGRATAGVGLALLTGAALWGLFGESPLSQAFVLADSLRCLTYAVVFAAAPLLVSSGFLLRGAVANPWVTAGAAATGAIGLGTLAVHAICLDAGGMHVLLGHFLEPLLAAALLAIPLAVFVHRR
jgi:hypothetical protein